MTPIRYPLDFTPWQPQRVIGFAGTWEPLSSPEARAVLATDVALVKAAINSAMEHALRKGGRNG